MGEQQAELATSRSKVLITKRELRSMLDYGNYCPCRDGTHPGFVIPCCISIFIFIYFIKKNINFTNGNAYGILMQKEPERVNIIESDTASYGAIRICFSSRYPGQVKCDPASFVTLQTL
jgi:hypothetical protein